MVDSGCAAGGCRHGVLFGGECVNSQMGGGLDGLGVLFAGWGGWVYIGLSRIHEVVPEMRTSP